MERKRKYGLPDTHGYAEALRILRVVGSAPADLVQEIQDRKTQADKIETYAVALGGVGISTSNQLIRGLTLLNRLSDDGWTPPEGLL